jgi:outer membrane receptor for ferrienterochelin and colicins
MIKRVEVVKGPASTLYGSEAVAGLINVITKSGVESDRLKIDFNGTTHGEFNMDAAAAFSHEKSKRFAGH